MKIDKLIKAAIRELDGDIAKQQAARAALAGLVNINSGRRLSAAARERIAAAQRLRWAKQRKAAKRAA